MTDRVPGAPGQYQASLSADALEKMQRGEAFHITLTRDDQPLIPGTPYSKAAVLPDALAQRLCPGVEDPTPADALAALLPKSGGTMTGAVDMGGNKVTGLPNPENDGDAVNNGWMRRFVGNLRFDGNTDFVFNLDGWHGCLICLANITKNQTALYYIGVANNTVTLTTKLAGDGDLLKDCTYADGKLTVTSLQWTYGWYVA